MIKKLIFSALITAVTAVSASAVPAKRGPYSAYNTDGKEILVQRVGDERGSWFLDMDGNLLMSTDRGFDFARIESDGSLSHSDVPVRFSRSLLPVQAPLIAPTADAIGRFPGTSFPSSGKQKALVVLVEFQDTKFSLGENTHQYFSDMLNKEGFNEYGGTGSAHEYFMEMSSGKFDCDFDVYGPVTLQNNYKYYGQNDKSGTDKYAYKMAVEACDALDAEVDFSQYDRDNDGDIDNIFIFYAGQGEASAYPQNDNLVWPHAYYVTIYGTHKYDDKRLNSYGCTNELEPVYSQNAWGSTKYEGDRPDGVGTFIHEFSHILGLPDLYLTDESELTASEQGYFTPGEWSVLDYGPYNNNGRTPPAYSAFERNALGWIDLEELTSDLTAGELTHIAESNHAYSITKHNKSTEFYLLECRKRSGWDKYIPYDGMLVWHIDYDNSRWYNNSVNNKGSHQYVDLIEADGIAEKTYRNGGDCFPGTKKVTELATKWWDKSSTGIKLSDITLTSDLRVTFTVNDGTGSNNPLQEWLSVTQLLDSSMDDSEVSVRGYIVGYVKSGTYNAKGVIFDSQNAPQTNVVIADTPDETNLDNCVPVQLVKSTDARTDLNLSDNPSMIGRQVELYGTASIYMSVPGLKNVSTYKLLDDSNSSIVEIDAEGSRSDAVYDLQGRRVLAPKAGNIYISKGKVIRY